jgi:RHS repeat-associated protein
METDADGAAVIERRFDPYGKPLAPDHGEADGGQPFGYTGEPWEASAGLLYLRARYYQPATGRFTQPDPAGAVAVSPQGGNRYAYGSDNPINYVDPSGLIRCLNSGDAKCISAARSLREHAFQLRTSVMAENDPLKPVEALAQLTNYAMYLFDNDIIDMMWGMTNVLVGWDPNDFWSLALAPTLNPYNVKFNFKKERTSGSHSGLYYVQQDWLPYKHDPLKDYYYAGDTQHENKIISSEIGDWNPKYFDGTSNQAYHFWYYAASQFYGGLSSTLPMLANVYHDPYYLEDKCGQDLIGGDGKVNMRDMPQPFSKWPEAVGGTSIEDYQLSIEGTIFGGLLRNGRATAALQAGAWIRQNLKSGN